MIDTGATTNFVNLQFCQRNRLKLVHITKQRVGMADNHIIVADKGLIGTYLEVFGKRTQENFVAVEGLKHAAIRLISTSVKFRKQQTNKILVRRLFVN